MNDFYLFVFSRFSMMHIYNFIWLFSVLSNLAFHEVQKKKKVIHLLVAEGVFKIW